MKICREFVKIKKLYDEGDEAGIIFYEAYVRDESDEGGKKTFQMLSEHCLCEREMGWCIPNLSRMLDRWAELDKDSPYDNGLSEKDIRSCKVYPYGTYGGGLVMRLLAEDGTIVQVVDIDKKDLERLRYLPR